MPRPDPKQVARAYLLREGRLKVAGEVIFKKDRGDDAGSWAFNGIAPSKREIPGDFNYSPRHQKPLAKILRATLAALGHTLSAYNRFAKIKSARVSPDGSLGGRGYIQKIADMRKQYMNCVEALSALADTIYDEVNAPHWALMSRQEDNKEKADVSALIDDAEAIRADPQQWAETEMAEEFDDDKENSLGNLLLEEESDWDSWDDTEIESTVPNIQLNMNGQRRASFKTTPQRTFEGLRDRVANAWVRSHVDQTLGGLVDTKSPTDFKVSQLKKGIQVEREHTKDLSKARKIAMDHLVEDPQYYDKLEKIEGGNR